MGLFGKIVQNTKLVAKTLRAVTRDRVSPPSQAPLPVGETRDYTAAELSAYDGTDPTRPVLLAIEGRVFDVTPGRSFYGKGGPYEMFAGKECAVALAKMSFEASDAHGDTSVLDSAERAKLSDWRETFEGKYRVLGQLLP
jgi:membrane-associated progesterone receptor component